MVNDIDSPLDGSGIIGVTSIAGSTLDAVALTGTDYTLVEVGGGEYTLTILFSSGKISTITTYSLALHVVSPAPEYKAADRTTTFIIRQLGTKIAYDPPLPTPWGNDVVITVYYLVEDTASAQHGMGITGVTSIAGSTLDAVALNPGDYTFVEVGGGEYTLTLLYSSGKLNTIKPTYVLSLYFVAPATQYADGGQTITFGIRSLTTQVTVDPPSPTPWGDDVIITFYYGVNDLGSTQHGMGIAGVTSLAGSTLGGTLLNPGDYSLGEVGGGQYTLTIFYASGKINDIQTYTLLLYVNPPSPEYDAASRSSQFAVRSIVTLLSYTPTPPVPRGTDVVILFTYTVNDPASSQHGTGIAGVTSIAGSTLDGSPLNPGEYTLIDNGGGQYTLTILYSSGKISTIKPGYALYLLVNSPDPQHNNANINIGFEIRTIRTAISYDAVGSTAWGLDVVITFYYIVDDSASGEDGMGIVGVTSIAGSTLDGTLLNPSDYTLVEVGGGEYTLTLLSTSGKIDTVKLYSLVLHVVSPDPYHEGAYQSIGFRIRNHYISSNIDPIATIPWENNGTMVIRIEDADLSLPINDLDLIGIRIVGPTTLIIDSSNWNEWVVNGTANDGIFTVNFTTIGWSLGPHGLTIDFYTSTSYEDDVVYATATIRALATTFTYQSPPVVAWGEDGILEVNYTVSDSGAFQDGDPITGATITILGLTVDIDFSYVDNIDGTYTITIFDSILTTNQTYYYRITITSPAQYANRVLTNVPITVRALFTTLTYSQIPTTPVGDNIIVNVEYLILDGQSSNNGAFIPGATLTVQGLGPLSLLPSDYYVDEFASYYRITITKPLTIGSYEIEVTAYHPTLPYRHARIANPPLSINIRTVYMEIEKVPVDAAPYGEDFDIRLIYRVRDDASSQDGLGIGGLDAINIVTNGTWTNPTYSVVYLGSGIYQIIINSAQTPSPGSYWINVTLGWIADPPDYEEQWVGVWLVSEYRETRIINTNPVDTGYADYVIVYLNYTDILTGVGIENSTPSDYVRIRILHAANDSEISASYFIEDITFGPAWVEPTLYYRVSIDASGLGAVNVIFNLKIEASWEAGNTPFYTLATKAFSVRTVGTETILFADTIATQPTGDDITILVHYETTGGLPVLNGTGYVGINVTCPDLIGYWDDTYWYVPTWSWSGTGGNYTIIIRGSKNLDVDTYSFHITLTWPTGFDPIYLPYYASADTYVSARVREIRTTLDWSQPSTVYYTQQLVITALYRDRDHGMVNISDVIWTIDVALPFSFYQDDGTWIITIDTSGLAAGAFSFYLTASKVNYEEQTRDVDITIHLAPLVLQKVDPAPGVSVIIVYWGEVIPITVYLEDGLTFTPLTPGDGASIRYQWYTFDWAVMTYTGTPGYYTISPIIDTGSIIATGTQLIIETNMTNYETEFFIFSLSIQPVKTKLDSNTPPGNSTAIQVYVEDTATLYVRFYSTFDNGSFWNFLNGATIEALNASTSLKLADFTFLYDGLYYCDFDTSLWRIQPQTITVTARTANALQQQVTFTITLLYKPCEIIAEFSSYSANYTDLVTINVFLNDTRDNLGIPNDPIYLIWQSRRFDLTGLGNGWYTGTFPANATPSPQARIISIYHEVYGNYAYAEVKVALTISKASTELLLVSAYTLNTIDGIEYNISVPFTDSSWFIPINDTLVLTFWYRDLNMNTLTSAEVLDAWFRYYEFGYFDYDNSSGYWTIRFRFNETSRPNELTIKFSSEYYIDQIVTKTLEVGFIPMELIYDSIPTTFYVGQTYYYSLYLNDTYHGAPVTGALFDPKLELSPVEGAVVEVIPAEVDGSYDIIITASIVCSGTLTITASKTGYAALNSIESALNIQFTEFMSNLITFGSFGAIVLIIALMGWILWARVYSIPWEVRRMRKLAKTVEKHGEYSLGRKDFKRFHVRNATFETKVSAAMDTIGVSATKLMIPKMEEVEEITASEEDIMAELDKIPGLGPEEKTVLANEMRKIPRKDRIWFLDDLRRQMGQRRMDFLTLQERPKIQPPETPTEKPPGEPEAPPLAEVAPKEPPPPKVLTEDRTAPTVLPPELQETTAASAVVVAEIRRELAKIPRLSKEEVEALVDHLQYLSKKERQATYNSLRQSADMED
ncbi:MAG: hypothetical protein ACFE89_12780 [Candidatus Hodarchaeota archaeon]